MFRPHLPALILTAVLTPHALAQSITAIAPLAGATTSNAVGVSASGTEVGCTSDAFGPGPSHGYRWKRNGQTNDMGLVPLTGTDVWASAISGNGEVLVGLGFNDHSPIRAVRWTRSGGLQDLGTLPGGTGGEAYAVSHDGKAVAGTGSLPGNYNYHAFRWTQQTGMQDLGTLIPGGLSFAYGISGDGRTVTGYANTADSEHAFRWTPQTGMQDLGALDPDEASGGLAISADGRTIVGYSGDTAAAWVNGVGKDLGLLDGGTFSVAYCAGSNGALIGGAADSATRGYTAMIWSDDLGMIDLQEYLPTLGVDLAGWDLQVTTGFSADARTIVGIGTFNDQERGWVVTLPPRCFDGHHNHHHNGHHNHHSPRGHHNHHGQGHDRDHTPPGRGHTQHHSPASGN
jgi:probable HAF family extracellular repeat protein